MEDVSAAANGVNPEPCPAADPDRPPPDTCVSHSQDPGVFAAHPSRASDTRAPGQDQSDVVNELSPAQGGAMV